MDKTAKNGIRIRTEDVTATGSSATGLLTVSVSGYADRRILFSTKEVADGMAALMLADFNGQKLSFVEEEEQTTVFIE
jgi:hypothetical protein